MGRRFFQRLQQRVERALTQHMHFINNEDLEPRPCRAVVGAGDNHIADVVDARVAGRVDLDHINVIAPSDRFAAVALVARLGHRMVRRLAVQAFCKDACGGCFAGPARAAK